MLLSQLDGRGECILLSLYHTVRFIMAIYSTNATVRLYVQLLFTCQRWVKKTKGNSMGAANDCKLYKQVANTYWQFLTYFDVMYVVNSFVL
jgi:hypothetical protein